MWKWIQELDRILRGDATKLSSLRSGKLEIKAGGLTVVLILLGVFSGFCVGWFALFNRTPPEYRQVIASMIKVPALFFLTLLVTFPSLYVFNALVGSRLTLPSLLRLIVAALAVTLAVLASFGSIVAFFSVTTASYPFMVILNVVVFAVAGFLGLAFLLQTLHRLTVMDSAPPASETGEPRPESSRGALERLEGHVLGRNVKSVFYCWIIVFGLVGAQMSWILRPFIGNPNVPFQWFRARQSHFFEAVGETLRQLLS
jgi:hypothetical protein